MSEAEACDAVSYHERTKHRFDGFARGPETIDWEAQPDPFRRFDGAPLQRLPLTADALELPFAELFSGKAITPRPLTQAHLALLLECSLALSAWKQYGSARWSLRCNPSSGNLHPTEAYLLCSSIDGIDDGLYHYRADEHALERRCRLTTETKGEATLLLGLSSVHWREAWKYGERAYRYCQLDVGHAVASLSYAAALLGWRVSLQQDVGDGQLEQLLGLGRSGDFGSAEGEHPDLLLAIHTGECPEVDIEALLARLESDQWAGQANVLDRRHHYDWPVIDAVAEACRRPPGMPAGAAIDEALPPALPSPCTEPAAQLIRHRRSAQAFDEVGGMEQEAFFRLLDHLLPRAEISPWSAVTWPARIHPVLFVHRVEGLKPGLYALPRRNGALALLQGQLRDEFQWEKVVAAPEHLPLYRLLSARAERTAARLSCQQAIAGDSAFSLSMLAEFDEVETTAWRYRELHWEAGAVGQVLYLEAESNGLRGTGIGCFFDDGVHELLGISGRELQALYHFTVGAPLQDARLISLPPYSREA